MKKLKQSKRSKRAADNKSNRNQEQVTALTSQFKKSDYPLPDLFHTASGDPYVTSEVNGHAETWPIRSTAFKRILGYQFYRTYGCAIPTAVLKDTLANLEAQARYDGATRNVFMRIGRCDDTSIVVDLANEGWQAVHITSDDWWVVDRPPVRFVRRQGMSSLPVPERGGSIKLLDDFLPLHGPTDRILFLSALLGFLHPAGPYPVLDIAGEQGTGKSTICRIARQLIDPSQAPLTTAPHNERDLHIAASKSWLQVFENLSRISFEFSDSLCRLATGAGLRTRKLFTDDDEVIFDAARPIIINSIVYGLITAGDLADRALIIRTRHIGSDERKDENGPNGIWANFKKVHPRILGALFSAVSVALRNLPHVHVERLPRMADFATWCVAGESGLGLESGSFLRAYEHNRQQLIRNALESSPLYEPILALLRGKEEWNGDMTRLLGDLSQFAPSDHRTWPRNQRDLRAQLDRIVTGLRAEGIDIHFLGQDAHTRRRLVRITKSVQHSNPSEASDNVGAMTNAEGFEASEACAMGQA